ncbi:MAG TPA: MOSC N-terminal beta barrel domain-containing protein [Solirubrobacteraceae bacterium]|jgi:hypothetical protein|nr:MOSC N-terminal beta barrel domain-containing protein [Solirubrobacteraceae bacterium]
MTQMGPVTDALEVTGLVTYPVKSCAGVKLSQTRVTPRGLELDRDFMLVADDGHFMSQRRVPEMALIVPAIAEHAITLSAPGMEPIEIPLELERDDASVVMASVHEKPVAGQLVGAELDEWFNTFLPPYKDNRRFRLLRVREDLPRYVGDRYRRARATNTLGFADGAAMLLACEPSLADLNAELDGEPVPMNRFRPNIVVDGESLAAYDEDHWTELRIGPMHAFVVKPSDRCVIPDVDQQTAATGKAVRRALLSRRGANAYDESNTGVFFAQNLSHVHKPGLTVRVGDAVRVLARRSESNVVLGSAARARVRQTA